MRHVLLVTAAGFFICISVLSLLCLKGERGERIGPFACAVHTAIAWLVILGSIYSLVMAAIITFREG